MNCEILEPTFNNIRRLIRCHKDLRMTLNNLISQKTGVVAQMAGQWTEKSWVQNLVRASKV